MEDEVVEVAWRMCLAASGVARGSGHRWAMRRGSPRCCEVLEVAGHILCEWREQQLICRHAAAMQLQCSCNASMRVSLLWTAGHTSLYLEQVQCRCIILLLCMLVVGWPPCCLQGQLKVHSWRLDSQDRQTLAITGLFSIQAVRASSGGSGSSSKVAVVCLCQHLLGAVLVMISKGAYCSLLFA